MKQLVIIAALAAAFAGCRSVEVVNYGEEVVRDQDGKPVLLADGSAQTVKKGWKVDHFQHWMATDADSLTAAVKAGEIDFAMNGLKTAPSEELNKLVDTSLKGAAELAAKVGAAIATAGGSTATEAAASALKKAIANYIAKGGDAAKATVTCENGNCTITDGTVTEVCENCMDVN